MSLITHISFPLSNSTYDAQFEFAYKNVPCAKVGIHELRKALKVSAQTGFVIQVDVGINVVVDDLGHRLTVKDVEFDSEWAQVNTHVTNHQFDCRWLLEQADELSEHRSPLAVTSSCIGAGRTMFVVGPEGPVEQWTAASIEDFCSIISSRDVEGFYDTDFVRALLDLSNDKSSLDIIKEKLAELRLRGDTLTPSYKVLDAVYRRAVAFKYE